jgi:hypothetical protein
MVRAIKTRRNTVFAAFSPARAMLDRKNRIEFGNRANTM